MTFSTITKRSISALLIALMLVLAACGGGTSKTDANTETSPKVEIEEALEEVPGDEEAEEVVSPAETVTLKVGATPAPHAEILEAIVDILAEQGIKLEIVVFNDYVLPNNAVANNELDANYFQHEPYLLDFNANNGTDLVSAAAIHYEPMGIFTGKTKTFDELKDGAQIAVPNDATNEARALQLLAQNGLLTLREGVGLEATVTDITENPKNIKFTEIEAAQVPHALVDVDMAVINGNYALGAGLNAATDAIATESAQSEAAQTFANIVAVRNGDESRPEIKAFVAALQSETAKKFIEEKYQGSVVPMF